MPLAVGQSDGFRPDAEGHLLTRLRPPRRLRQPGSQAVPGCKVGGQSPTMMSILTLPTMANGRDIPTPSA
jgi:hypothetical protein